MFFSKLYRGKWTYFVIIIFLVHFFGEKQCKKGFINIFNLNVGKIEYIQKPLFKSIQYLQLFVQHPE